MVYENNKIENQHMRSIVITVIVGGLVLSLVLEYLIIRSIVKLRADRIVQGYALVRLQAAKMHKYFVFDTTGGEGRELRAFTRLEVFDRFDQADGADRDQIFEIFTRIEFLS